MEYPCHDISQHEVGYVHLFGHLSFYDCITCFIAAIHIEQIKMDEISCFTFVHMRLCILIFTAHSELQKVLFLAPSVCWFFVCV